MIWVYVGIALIAIFALTIGLCVAAKPGDRMEAARRRLDAESQGRKRVGW
jgi:hypothetical protein